MEMFVISCLLIPLILSEWASANPYGYYSAYSRMRRDPSAWDRGYGGLVQQNQMPVVPNSVGNYGGPMESHGMGMANTYSQGSQRDPNLYASNQYNRKSPIDNSLSNQIPIRQDSAHHNPMGNMQHNNDLNSFQAPPQQYASQYGGANGGLEDMNGAPDEWDSDIPEKCRGVECEDLVNCVNVTYNESKCCPECKVGCFCQGYQFYHCQLNGFGDWIPGGKSYLIAEASTICTCPPAGGEILCSPYDPLSSKCPEVTPNCIDTFVREIDQCEECTMIGCIGDDGTKLEAGKTLDKAPCTGCFCPSTGGTMVCGEKPDCIEKQNPNSNSLAMESSIREINSMGGRMGYNGFNNYAGYPDYGYGRDSGLAAGGGGAQAGGSPVIPPMVPVGDSDKSATGNVGQALPGGIDSQSGKKLGTGLNPYGYQQGYNLGYQGQYNYGQTGQGYTGYQGYHTGYEANPYRQYDQQGYPQPVVNPAVKKVKKVEESSEGAVPEDSAQAGASANGMGAGGYQQGVGYPYYNQGSIGAYNSFGTMGQQRYEPSLTGAGYPSYPNSEYPAGAKETISKSAESNPISQKPPLEHSDSELRKPEAAQDHGNSEQQASTKSGQGYPYTGYRNQAYYQQYNPYQGYDQYPQKASSPKVPAKLGQEATGELEKSTGQSEAADGANMVGQRGSYGEGYDGYRYQYDPFGYRNSYGNYPQQFGGIADGSQGAGNVNAESPSRQANRGIPDSADPQNQGQDRSGQTNVGPLDTADQLSNMLPSYTNDHQSNYGAYPPYQQGQQQIPQQYPGYPNIVPSQGGSRYEPVDPSLIQPHFYGREPEPSDQPVHSLNNPSTRVKVPVSRKIKDISLVEKNRHHSHIKATPTLSSSTTEILQLAGEKHGNVDQVSYENILSRCCYRGRQWALDHEICSGIEVTVDTYAPICAVAQEKCCLEAKEQQFCQGGIDTARSMAACDVPANLGRSCGGNEFKTCCDCCAMGLKALGLGLSCDVKIFGEPCNHAYLECCQSGRIGSVDSLLPDIDPTLLMPAETEPTPPESTESTGPRCVTDSECQQVCRDVERKMVCSCRRGYRLHENKKDCVDVNECVLETHSCTEHEFCLNKEGSFTCQRRISCGTGYELTQRNTCEDIDECGLEIHDCFGNMVCENIRGSYRCIPKLCDEGYFTDATGRCLDIDECRAREYRCPRGAHCVNTDGSYDCQCPIGLQADEATNACQDIDECTTGAANCIEGATCINTEGSFVCKEPPKLRCSPGYQPNEEITECIDIDECSEGTHTCNAGSTCINVKGGFRCQDPLICGDGLEADEDQRLCLDINECRNPLLHRCNEGGRCINLHTTFKCLCNTGYVNAIADDGIPTCSDVDECSTSAGDRCKYMCKNKPGSFECICPSGYKLSTYGSTCEDIDECGRGEFPCSSGETCFNTYGSYRCVALTCPTGYTNMSNTRCQRKSCRILKTKNCTKMPKQISYHNITLPNATVANKPLFRMTLSRYHSTDRYEFFISSGNEMGDFKVRSSSRIRRPTGVVYTSRELVGPSDYVVDLTLKLIRQRRVSIFVSRLYIFVSEYDL